MNIKIANFNIENIYILELKRIEIYIIVFINSSININIDTNLSSIQKK